MVRCRAAAGRWRCGHGLVAIAAVAGRAQTASDSCGLSQLDIWAGENTLKLQPAFSDDIVQYRAHVDYQTLGFWVDPTPATSSCEARRSDSTSDIPPGQVGTISVTLRSTALTQPANVYSVTVERRRGDDTTLRYLDVRGARVLPAFQPQVYEYSVFPMPSVPLVLSGIPTDSGERLEILSITPHNNGQPQPFSGWKVTRAGGQVPGLLPKPGPRKIKLGFLKISSDDVVVLRLPSSMKVGGGSEVPLPARIALAVHPPVEGKVLPSTYTLLVNAPSKSHFKGSAIQPLTNVAGMLATAAKKVAAKRAAKAAAAAAKKAAAKKVANAASTVTTSSSMAMLATTTASPPGPATSITAIPATTTTAYMIRTTTVSTIPDWAKLQPPAQGKRESSKEKKGEDVNAAQPYVIGVMLFLAVLLIFKSCTVNDIPLYRHCRNWIRLERQPFCEVPEEVVAPEADAPAAPIVAQTRPATEADAELLRAMVMGTT